MSDPPPAGTPVFDPPTSVADDDGHPPDADAASSPRPDRIGRYIVLAELGSGGMGVVYRAWDPALERTVALKVLSAGRFAGKRQLARFASEARAIARLDDPALVSIHDLGVIDGCPYFTMELVEGPTLAALLDAQGPLAPDRAARLAARIARGLDHAHRQGVVHRDVKPANVLIDADGDPRLIDFGIARLLEASDALTRTGAVLGTPDYMAPEQAAGRTAAVGPATDVYGVGALIYAATTRRAPHPVSPARPLTGAGALPRDLRAICLRALAFAPADRYRSAAALADELDRFGRGEPVEAALPNPARRLGWWLHRRRAPLIAVASTALVALTVAAAISGWRDAREAAEAADARARREEGAAARLDEALAAASARRAAGEDEAAAAIEREVAQRGDVDGTRALARFHLARATDAATAQDIEAALTAASAAYATVDGAPEQLDALLLLGRLFVEARDADRLAAVDATLARRFPRHTAERGPVELYRLVFAGRLLDAAAHPRAAEIGWAPMLRVLGRGTPTAHRLPTLSAPRGDRDPMTLADADSDGQLEVWLGGRAYDARSPSLPLTAHAPLPMKRGAPAIIPLPGLPGLFAHLQNPDGQLLRRDGEGWRPLARVGLLQAHTTSAADLDRDGAPEVYYDGGGELRALSATSGDGWTDGSAHPPTEAASSYINVVRAAELGGPTLLVGTQGWRAYDLRVFRSAGRGRLTPVARRQIGQVFDAVTLSDRLGRLVVASTYTEHADPALFHRADGLPFADGLHTFALTDDGLEHRATLPVAPGELAFLRIYPGDLDGDGLTDLVALASEGGRRRFAVVFRRLPDGWAPSLPLLGLRPFGVLDVDGDGDVELLANDTSTGRLWTVGAGDTPTPIRATRPLAPEPAATGRAGAIEDLVALGRLGDALDAWQREVRHGRAPIRAARRGAEIAEQLGRYDDAAALHLRVADDPAQRVEALRAAADALAAARRPVAERATLTRLVDDPAITPSAAASARARIAALDARLSARVELAVGDALDAGWQIRVPDRLRLDRSALRVRGDAVGEIARLPLRRVAERVAFEIDLETPRVEFGGAVVIALVGALDDGREVDLAHVIDCGWGGGSLVYHRLYADFGGGGHVLFANRRQDGVAGRPLRAHVEYDHTRGSTLVIDRDGTLRERQAIDAAGLGDRLALVIRTLSDTRWTGATTEVRIRRLVIDGVELAPASDPSPDPAIEAARALAERRPAVALATLGERDDATADAIRIAALYDLGRWPDADALLTARLRAGIDEASPLDPLLVGRLRQAPMHVAPLVRAAWGARADALFWRVFAAGFAKHPDDPAGVRAASAVLLGADLDPRRVIDHPAPERRLDLLLARARMRRTLDELGGARADLDLAAEMWRLLPPTEDPARAAERDRLRSAVRLEQAALEVVDAPEAAIALIRTALADSGAPEIVADRIRADAALRRLRDQPVWDEVEAAARWAGTNGDQ